MIWVVRDFCVGEMMPFVSVWSEKPKRWNYETGRVWFSDTQGDWFRGWLGSLWIHDAWMVVGTVPDDDRQVIVMDRDPVKIRAKINLANGYQVPKP